MPLITYLTILLTIYLIILQYERFINVWWKCHCSAKMTRFVSSSLVNVLRQRCKSWFRLFACGFLPHDVGLLGMRCLFVRTLVPVCQRPVTPLPAVPQQTSRTGGHRCSNIVLNNVRVHNPINYIKNWCFHDPKITY